jgi:hypothetical protein
LFSFAAAAHASIIALPTSGPGTELVAGDVGFGHSSVTSGSFTIDYFFQLGSPATVNGFARDVSNLVYPTFDIASITVALYQGSTLIVQGLADAATSIFSPITIGAGSYSLRVTGIGAAAGGVYTTAVGVRVAPVPLPAAAWLLLSGLVGIGTLAKRRGSSPLRAVA